MNVAVSGASGLIGRALVPALAGAGHRVVRLQRPAAGASAVPAIDGAATTTVDVAWDPRNGTIDREALEAGGPIDAVVNLSGAGIGDRRWTTARRREILASRLAATELLVRTIGELDPVPSVLVNASAIGYYGDRGDEILTEDSPAGTGFLADVCRTWESAAGRASEHGTRVVVLRTGVVLARHGGALGKQLPIFKLGLGGRLGSGHQYLSWITLRDEVDIVARAIDDTRFSGPINATAPEPVTNRRFAADLGRALHRPAVLVVPRPALAMALGTEMAEQLLLASQRVRPARLEAIGHRFTGSSLAAALPAVLTDR